MNYKSLFSAYFKGKQVEVMPYNGLTRQQGGAYHFDPRELSALLNLRKIDIDVLFLNQPELTPAFLDYFNKVHFFDVHSLGYIHWMDWKRCDNTSSWVAWTVSGNALAIDFLAISDAEDQNHQTIVFDLADEPVIAHAIFPELSKPRTVERLSDAA